VERAPPRIAAGAAKHGDASLIAATSVVSGTVQRSVVFEGTEIRRGAEVIEAVILPGAVIGAGSRLRGVIVDGGCRVPEGTVIDRSAGGAVPFDRLKPAVVTREVASAPELACAVA
jgi:glucose-1-phosphate adenylyltransferase